MEEMTINAIMENNGDPVKNTSEGPMKFEDGDPIKNTSEVLT